MNYDGIDVFGHLETTLTGTQSHTVLQNGQSSEFVANGLSVQTFVVFNIVHIHLSIIIPGFYQHFKINLDLFSTWSGKVE